MAERAGAVGGRERHHDDVALLDLGDLRSDVLDDADGLVAHRLPGFRVLHRRVRPQVAAADTGARNAHDRIGRFDDGRVRDVLDADIAGGVHDGCSHALQPSTGPRALGDPVKVTLPGSPRARCAALAW